MNVAFSAASGSTEIRTRRCGRCYVCGTDGKWLHKNVVDHYFGAPGIWSFRRCANHECRLIWLDAMHGLPIYLTPSRREAVDFPLRYLADRPTGRLLDIGCGDGTMLEQAMSLGWSVEGADFVSKAVAKGRRKDLEVNLGAVEDLNLPDAAFYLILMSHLIEQVYDPIGLLRECRRLLTPGGKLIVATPNAESLGHSKFGADWVLLHAPRH